MAWFEVEAFEMGSLARYTSPKDLAWLDRLLNAWFAPKAFESEALYERLGIRWLKRYVPTGGDFFIQRYGVRIVQIRPDLDAMVHFEQLTRIHEAIHLIAFIGFVIFSLRRWLKGKTSFAYFVFALAVYILLILSPAALQRYNRIRVYRAIQILARRQTPG